MACNQRRCFCATFAVFLVLSIGLLAGGIVERDKYDTVPCTVTSVSGCAPICHEYDYNEGGGGGSGGEKRNIRQEVHCQGAAFLCNLEWLYNGTRFSANNVDASWDNADYPCEKLSAGMAATVVIKRNDPAVALDVHPPNYTRPPVLMIFGICLLTIVLCAGMCCAFVCGLCKRDRLAY